MSADISKTLDLLILAILSTLGTGFLLIRFDIGTRPMLVLTFRSSIVDKSLSFSGNLTLISSSSSELSVLILPRFIPLVTSCMIPPIVATSVPYIPVASTSTSNCQSIPGKGRVSPMSLRAGFFSNLFLIISVACNSLSLFIPDTLINIGLGEEGPLICSEICAFTPGNFLSLLLISSIISLPGFLLFHSDNSI